MKHVYTSFLILLFLLVNGINASSVLKYNGAPQPLDKMWQWAEQQSRGQYEYWIGYSISQVTQHDVTIGSYFISRQVPTLAAILSRDEQGENEIIIFDPNNDKTEKGLAFLFLMTDKNKHDDAELHISHFDRQIDLRDKPLYWLGNVDQQESFSWIEKMYKSSNPPISQKHLMVAASQHRVAGVVPFLSAIPFSHVDVELQKDAVFWLGQIPDAEVLPILEKALFEHEEHEVQKAAVFALHECEDERSVDLLIKACKKHPNHEIRKEAIFWLGQLAGEKAAQSLKDIAYSEPELELKKQAVFALSERDDDFGLESLIQIAQNHPSKEVRKTAIFWLGESGDPKALDAIVGIIKEN